MAACSKQGQALLANCHSGFRVATSPACHAVISGPSLDSQCAHVVRFTLAQLTQARRGIIGFRYLRSEDKLQLMPVVT